jgi:hypothetical protein
MERLNLGKVVGAANSLDVLVDDVFGAGHAGKCERSQNGNAGEIAGHGKSFKIVVSY